MPLIVTGPPGAREALGGIEEAPFFPTSLIGLIWLTRQAVAVVGVDSGPLHLAAALGKCGVAIYGPTDPARNGPYGGSIAVLRSPNAVTTYKRASAIDPSMRAISPEAVFQALRERFGRSASAGRHAR
jgi:heptosyltransferase-1